MVTDESVETLERRKRGKRSKLRGAAKERAVKAFLESRSYCCSKSSASLGMADIIAVPYVASIVSTHDLELARQLDRRKVLLIQVKSAQVYGKELQMYREFAERLSSNCEFQIWVIPYGKSVDEADIVPLP